MAKIGLFDPNLRAITWFDEDQLPEGWFSSELIGPASTSVIHGTLAATEANDTASVSGKVLVKGNLAATETGTDTFAASGTTAVVIHGSLAATESGTDTLAAAGKVLIKGSLASTESGVDTLSASGKVFIKGSLAATEANDTLAASGKVLVKGSLAATETGVDTLAASGKVLVKGSLAATETGADAFVASGKVLVKGSLAATETGIDVFSASGSQTIHGSLAATEANDTLAALGKVLVKGTLAATETGIDTLAASGKVLVKGSLTATETGIDVFHAGGTELIQGYLAATEASDIFAATGVAGTEYKWDTSQGKAPSNQFVALRQTTTHAQKAGLKLRTAKVAVKTTAFVHVHNNLAVKTAKVIGGSAKVKSYTGSTFTIPRHRLTGNTERVIIYKCNTVCANITPKAELIYSIPDVITSSPTVVRTQMHSAKMTSYRTNVKTVQNPTDDELRAIMLLMRQQKLKQAASFRKMM